MADLCIFAVIQHQLTWTCELALFCLLAVPFCKSPERKTCDSRAQMENHSPTTAGICDALGLSGRPFNTVGSMSRMEGNTFFGVYSMLAVLFKSRI